MAFVFDIMHFESGILAIPVESYIYGLGFIVMVIGITIAGLFTAVFYLPLFYHLNFNSVYQVKLNK